MAARKCRALIRLVFAGLVALPFMAGSKPAAACAAEPFIGSLCVFAGNFPPRGWAFAEGQLLAISENTALFSILGTTYGGDGRTTFALPDLRGRMVISAGQGPGLQNYIEGAKGGNETSTLAISNMPAHNHGAVAKTTAADDTGNIDTPGGSYWASESRTEIYFNGTPTTPAEMASDSVSVSIGNTGGNTPFSNQPPYLAMRWIIALVGLYPSRN